MNEPKTAKDMEKLAKEVLNVVKFEIKTKNGTSYTIRPDDALVPISHYLLDAYNEGYDDAIISQSARRYKID